jgi:hypothetical protein
MRSLIAIGSFAFLVPFALDTQPSELFYVGRLAFVIGVSLAAATELDQEFIQLLKETGQLRFKRQ